MISGEPGSGLTGRRRGAKRALAAAAVACAVLAAGNGVAAGAWLSVENRSEHPVKVAVPGAPAATIAPGADPARIEATSDGDTGVTARLWWTSDPRQLCQIYTPWERTITVTGSREILCRSR